MSRNPAKAGPRGETCFVISSRLCARAHVVVERERDSLSFANRGDERNRDQREEGRDALPRRRMKSEIDHDDAEEEGKAVGDDHEEPGVAAIGLVHEIARRTPIVRADAAAKERNLTAARTTAAKYAAKYDGDWDAHRWLQRC